jgi:hypothetical protein
MPAVAVAMSGSSAASATADAIAIDTTTSGATGGWRIQKRGLYYIIASPRHYSLAIPSQAAQRDGWKLVQVCAARARFVSPGTPSTMTIYADGRTYLGGTFHAQDASMSDADEQARQHQAPAEVRVDDSVGRLDRATPGDANNDGYNETWGVYELRASGGRMEFEISPRTAVLSRAMIEIAGLPPGPVCVTMEGRLITDALRLDDGHLLIEIPGVLQRPTRINVHVD